MKDLKITIIMMMLVLPFIACKKEKPVVEEEAKTVLDIKQYFIAGTYIRTLNGKNFEHPYVVTFEENGQARIYDWGAVGNIQVSYTFADNILTIDYGGEHNWIFTINDEGITKAEGLQSYYKSSNLYKIPSTNQFTGNWYSGMMLSRENSSSMYFAYKFTADQYQETVHLSSSTHTYTVIKNIMAISSENGIARYFLALEGKLNVSRYNFGVDPPANFFFASLSKDN